MSSRRGLGLALLCAVVPAASLAHAQDIPRCGAPVAAGAPVQWHGLVEDGYVEPSPSGQARFVFVLACRDSAGGATTAARFGLRLDDITMLPPSRQELNRSPFREWAVLSVAGQAAPPDTVRGLGGSPIPFVAARAVRYAAPADSVAALAAMQRAQQPRPTAPDVLFLIDGVEIGGGASPMLSHRMLWLSIDRIEVVRGPAARQRFGDRAGGGAIIVLTKRPQT